MKGIKLSVSVLSSAARLLEVATQKDSGLSSGDRLALLKSIMDHSPDGSKSTLSYVSDNINDTRAR